MLEITLATGPGELSWARADYLPMLHFGTSWVDMMLWQIRINTHLLYILSNCFRPATGAKDLYDPHHPATAPA